MVVERKRKHHVLEVEEDDEEEMEEEKSEVGADELDIDAVYELLGVENGTHNSQFGVPRKRERLTNLTAEEKLNRRKMKNRVAAQTARDRKKERSQKMEEIVKHLLEETKRLRAENQELRRENTRILQQQQKGSPPLSSFEVSSSEVELSSVVGGGANGVGGGRKIMKECGVRKEAKSEVVENLGIFGSAAFINEPLPWERIPRSSLPLKSSPTTNNTINSSSTDMSSNRRQSSNAVNTNYRQQRSRAVAKQLLRTLLCSMLTMFTPTPAISTSATTQPQISASQRSTIYRPFSRTSSRGLTLPTLTNSATKSSKKRLLLQRCLAALMQRRSRRRTHFSSSEMADQHWEKSQEDLEEKFSSR